MTAVPSDAPTPADPADARARRTALRLVLRKTCDALTFGSALSGAVSMLVLLGALFVVLVLGAWPAIHKFGFSFLVSNAWDYRRGQFGAWPVIQGTLVSSFVALVIAVPLSLGSAIFLVRLAPKWLINPISFLIELLAAIPSITYGMWGMLVMVPYLHSVTTWIHTLRWVPLGGKVYFPGCLVPATTNASNMLAAGLILALMITPIITAITRDVLRSVPPELEQGAYGLGATWWQATRVVLSFAKMGIFGAIILGLGRALGETMAVTMVIGNSIRPVSNLFQPGATIASLLAVEFPNWDSNLHRQSLIYAALVLLLVTMLINAAARFLVIRTASRARA